VPKVIVHAGEPRKGFVCLKKTSYRALACLSTENSKGC